jgi:hypothetical protein
VRGGPSENRGSDTISEEITACVEQEQTVFVPTIYSRSNPSRGRGI